MKITNKIDLNREEKTLSTPGGVKASGRKTGKKHKPLAEKDRIKLGERQSINPKGIKNFSARKTEKPQKNWTVLCYYAGDNNLEEEMSRDFVRLEKSAPTDKINFVAQFDRGAKPSSRQYGGKAGAVRYEMRKTDDSGKISSPEVKEFGQINSADPKVFNDFLAWGMKNYPANNYFIYIDGHGAGIPGLITDGGPEASHHHIISLPEFKGAVQKAEKEAGVAPEQVLLGAFTCLNSQAEAAGEFKDMASQLLLSQSSVGNSWHMEEIFASDKTADYDLEQMGRHIFKTNAESDIGTLALMDLKKVPQLEKSLREFTKAVKNSPVSKEALKAIIEVESRPNFDSDTQTSFFASDFYTLADTIAKNQQFKDPKLRKAAQTLRTALNQVILQHYRKDQPAYNKNAHGMGIATASQGDFYRKTAYRDLAFEKETGWGDFLLSYAPGVKLGEKAGLSEPVKKLPPIKAPHLTEEGKIDFREQPDKTAQVAAKWLNDKAGLKKEIAKVKRGLKNLSLNPDLSAVEQGDKAYDIAFNNRCLLEGFVSTKSTLIQSFLCSMASAASHNPVRVGDIFKTGLLALSALEGEISTKTISQAACNLLESKENIHQRVKFNFGVNILIDLAKNARNDKVIAAINQGGLDAEKQIRAVADLGQKKRSEA